MRHDQVQKLNQFYSEGESVDKSIFSEMRSNCRLYIGAHYPKRDSQLRAFFRSQPKTSTETKVRLTKNHLGVICRRQINALISHSPNVSIEPKHDSEMADKKAAQLNNAVWKDISHRHKMSEKIADWAFDFTVMGECIAKVSFDPNKGKFLGYDQVLDETGMVVVDPETGEPEKGAPKFAGDMFLERVEAFNLLRDPSAKYFDEATWVCYRKMIAVKELQELYSADPDKVKAITESSEDTYTVFDGATGDYGQTSKEKVMLREFYFRPCVQYPKGYYYLSTSTVILEEGELPLGIFPIIIKGYDNIPTSARSHSSIKAMRPMQAEINRLASTMAQNQLTFQSKLLIRNGSKLSHGGQVAGVRGIRFSGDAPIVMKGETGHEYLPLLEAQVEEMYRISNIRKEEEEKGGNLDPHTLMFRSMKDKKKFSMYSDKFEAFLVEVAEVTLQYAKAFYNEDHLIPAIDKREHINIAEFQSQEELSYQIKIIPMTEDVESKIGKVLSIQHAIQYAGSNLSKEDIGMLLSKTPYLQDEEMFDDITIDYRAVQDVILAMDRGEQLAISEYDNHEYFIKKLTNAMRESGFQFKDEQIQALYEQRLQTHMDIKARQSEEISRAQAGFVPQAGALITIPSIKNNAGEVIRVPYQALEWLVLKLDEQGTFKTELTSSIENQGAIAGISNQINTQQPNQGQANAS